MGCLYCGKELKRKSGKYCDAVCQHKYIQKLWVDKWISGEADGNCNSKWTQTKDRVRTYLFDKYNSKCARCGWGEKNPYTGKIPLEVEHIDGNPYNTSYNNVTLLCPNCHSLTKSYRGANRGSGRKKTWVPKE